MPHYFFDTDDGRTFVIDDLGIELGDRDAARQAAVAALLGMAGDVLPHGSIPMVSVAVRDEEGTAVLQATLTLRIDTPEQGSEP